jgi:hypothetical protein
MNTTYLARLENAIVALLDGQQVHELVGSTGLSESSCKALGDLKDEVMAKQSNASKNAAVAVFESYEISFVAEFQFGGCEVVEELDPNANRHMWSLYGRTSNGPAEIICDRYTRSAAMNMYQRICGGSVELVCNGPEIDPHDAK